MPADRHRTSCLRLLLRLATRKPDALRFLADPLVLFTNNLVERDADDESAAKISGGFRSEDGTTHFAVIRSVLSTARKQGWNILHTLTADPQHLIANLPHRLHN